MFRKDQVLKLKEDLYYECKRGSVKVDKGTYCRVYFISAKTNYNSIVFMETMDREKVKLIDCDFNYSRFKTVHKIKHLNVPEEGDVVKFLNTYITLSRAKIEENQIGLVLSISKRERNSFYDIHLLVKDKVVFDVIHESFLEAGVVFKILYGV